MICEKEKCTGCFACYNICPKECIEMKEDEMGAIYPNIDKKKCINCGLCKKVCPSIKKVEQKKPLKAYAFWNLNEKERLKSSSGGAATIFYKYVLELDGVVYGVSYSNNISFEFNRVDNIKDLDKLRGSKYVHAYINNTYKKVKSDLLNGRKVLFVGTPCQVAGLKKYLLKEYDDLITVDLVCHGVPPQKLLLDEVKTHINDVNKISNISFRDNKGYNLKICSKYEKCIKQQIHFENFYLTGFSNSLFLRENCYKCIYANRKRVSDITIGDFWGLGEKREFNGDVKKGVSLVMPITKKGLSFINKCAENNNVFIEERNIDEAVDGNSQLKHPSLKNKKTIKFKKLYLEKGYKVAVKKTLGCEVQFFKVKKFAKKLIHMS